MPPLTIDIIALLPQELALCKTCTAFLDQVRQVQTTRERSLDSYPPEYQREIDHLAGLIENISGEFGEKVIIRLVDPRSLEGLIKLIRHGIRSYPTLLIQGNEKITVMDWEPVRQAILSARQQAETA